MYGDYTVDDKKLAALFINNMQSVPLDTMEVG